MNKCQICGKKVFCPEHGYKYIREDEDNCGLKFYYCLKCVEQYNSALGSIVHDHLNDMVKSKEFERAIKEVFK